MKFYSHPDVLLKKHLFDVAVLSFETQPVFLLKEASCIIGALHDFGKYTSFFQKHLLTGKEVRYSQHSFISAVLTYFALLQNYPGSLIPLIGFDAVLSHHSTLSDMDDFEEFVRIGSSRSLDKFHNGVEAARSQIADMRNNKDVIAHEFKEISELFKKNAEDMRIPDNIRSFEESVARLLYMKEFSPEISVKKCADIIRTINLGEFFNNFEGYLKKIAKDSYSLMDSEVQAYNYLYLIFSVLIDSDKRNAGKIKMHKRLDIPSDIVDKYENEKFKNVPDTEMNEIRTLLYEKVNSQISEINIDKDRIFTITAPTGSGKTLTSFSFALKLREEVKKAKGYVPRIIYSLPFISIIEQNYGVFKEVLSSGLPDFDENESAYVLPHHHLAPVKFKEGGEEKSVDESLAYMESWDSEVIVTTFIQFLYSVIAYKNRFLKKYHNIYGSVIILDEVQNIPIDYWDAVGNVLKDLTEKLNCYVILMTATKPLIFDSCRELFPQNEQAFERMNRVRFNIEIESKDENAIYENFLEKVESGKSYLFVMNTIRSSQNLYKYIKENASFETVGCPESIEEVGRNKRPLFYLSSLIVPFDRHKRIETIKKFIKNGMKPILISTQVVEAGVDLDFDIVFRDIAPIDSIVQAAGRCNRAWNRERGNVNIVKIDSLANYVYRKVLPNISESILDRFKDFEEPQVAEIVNLFFKEAKERAVNEDASKEIEEALRRMKFSVLDKFVLINSTNKESVFVAANEDAEEFITKFTEEISKAEDFIEKHRIYLQNRTKISLFTVNVSSKNLPQAEGNFYIVHNNQLDEYYDLETGYKKDVVNPIW